jgi:hypothetical protein
VAGAISVAPKLATFEKARLDYFVGGIIAPSAFEGTILTVRLSAKPTFKEATVNASVETITAPRVFNFAELVTQMPPAPAFTGIKVETVGLKLMLPDAFRGIQGGFLYQGPAIHSTSG